MRLLRHFFFCLLFLWLALSPVSAAPRSFSVPVTYYKLPNGLRVILSPDASAPTVATATIAEVPASGEATIAESPVVEEA